MPGHGGDDLNVCQSRKVSNALKHKRAVQRLPAIWKYRREYQHAQPTTQLPRGSLRCRPSMTPLTHCIRLRRRRPVKWHEMGAVRRSPERSHNRIPGSAFFYRLPLLMESFQIDDDRQSL